MNYENTFNARRISRRRILQGAGVGLALPMLDAMGPKLSFARSHVEETGEPPRRMLAICNNLGLLPKLFFPSGAGGASYPLSPYLSELERHRDDFTVFSGVWHPDVDGGHPADNCFLTAAPHPGSGGFRNSISLDQYLAEHIGPQTRFPSMTLGVNVQQGLRSLSWTGAGVLIPCEEKAANVFAKMFLQGSEKEIQRQVQRLQQGESVMDAVAGQASQLMNRLGTSDRGRLDQYLTGVRELEKRMAQSREWEYRPKPKPSRQIGLDPAAPRAYMEKVRLMYDISTLAFETDSTRLITLLLDSVNSPAIEIDGMDITDGYHNLSHHGRNEEKLKQLEVIDRWHMRLLAELFDKLKSVDEGSGSLMDHTMVLYGSNLGDANTHVTTNLPVLFAGGGFRHGQHLAFDNNNNYPLPNLFVSMCQRMGLEVDRFATSTGTMRGLNLV